MHALHGNGAPAAQAVETIQTGEADGLGACSLSSLLERSIRLTTPVLASRAQTAIVEAGAGSAFVGRRGSRIVALLSCALQEMAACTIRGGAISCQMLQHVVVMRGENPIVIPENGLVLDWLMLVRAKALGIEPLFHWEQGRGPVLTLILPEGRKAASLRGRGATLPRRARDTLPPLPGDARVLQLETEWRARKDSNL